MKKLRLFQRAEHFWQRLSREKNAYPERKKAFGQDVARVSFWDGLIPPGKSHRYISTVSSYVDAEMLSVIRKYSKEKEAEQVIVSSDAKIPVWCCWWQGEDSMPEIVKLCYNRLQQVLPDEKAELHLITLDNYTDYVKFPEHIQRKFEAGIITMTAMSDVLRFQLLEKYGGYWVDATVFFSDEIPEQYFLSRFFCQRMVKNIAYTEREACRGNWCGFSMAGPAHSIIFRYMNDAFALWWKKYDEMIDYVLIDYLLLSGYHYVPLIKKTIDSVPDNNEDIFEMYQVLNQPYTEELWQRLTRRNVMHKLTYKMDVRTMTEDGQLTIYGHLHQLLRNDEKKSVKVHDIGKISVIIPVFNAGHTVIRCVDSIQKNTYKNLEVILIEDGSADNSWTVCSELADKYGNVVALKNDENRGVSYTRNRGLEAATGEYIMFADSDDWLEPDYYESFTEQLFKNPHALIVCGFINHDEKYHNRVDTHNWSGTGEILNVERVSALEVLYEKTLLLQLWNKVFLSSVIRKEGIRFDETISIGEDFRFVLTYLQYVGLETITIIDKPLYHYMRDQKGSLMFHVGYESIEEPLKNLRMLYQLEGYAVDEIEEKLTAAREVQLGTYAYIIMQSAAMSQVEKKRLIVNLDQEKGIEVYRKTRKLLVKENISRALRRWS